MNVNSQLQSAGRICYLAFGIVLLVLASCGGRITEKSHVVRQGAPDELLPVKIGMSMESAYNAIGGSGQFVETEAKGLYKLNYLFYIDNYSFSVTHEFDNAKRVASASLVSVDAYKGAEDAHECSDFFYTIISKIAARYGAVDFKPKFHKENGFIHSTGVFTFEDSSNIKAEYSYPENQYGVEKCKVSIHQNMPWVDGVCRATGGRNCDRQPDLAPMMRTPWSRFK